MTMKHHSKTSVNKAPFKKIVNELYFNFRKVNNLFCHKTANAEGSFLPSI